MSEHGRTMSKPATTSIFILAIIWLIWQCVKCDWDIAVWTWFLSPLIVLFTGFLFSAIAIGSMIPFALIGSFLIKDFNVDDNYTAHRLEILGIGSLIIILWLGKNFGW